jgi:ribose transport system substrate-binding protein
MKMFLGLILVTILVGACGKHSVKPLKFAWIPQARLPIYSPGKDAATQKARELSTQGKIQVSVDALWSDDFPGFSTAPATAHGAAIQAAIDGKYDGIAMQVYNLAIDGPLIDSAVDHGIPVLIWDTVAPGRKQFTRYDMDNLGSGRIAAKVLSKLVQGTGRIAVLHHSDLTAFPNIADRIQGVAEEVATHPNMREVFVPCDLLDPLRCKGVIESAMQTYPDISGWFFASLWGPSIARPPVSQLPPTWAAAWQNGQLKSIAYGGSPDHLDALDAGRVQMLVTVPYFGWGYDTIQMLFDRVTQNKSFPELVTVSVNTICGNNSAAMRASWASNDFSLSLGQCSYVDSL